MRLSERGRMEKKSPAGAGPARVHPGTATRAQHERAGREGDDHSRRSSRAIGIGHIAMPVAGAVHSIISGPKDEC